MNAMNAVQVFVLVWISTSVCQADDKLSVSCEDVTGTVGNEVTLTCSVSQQSSECCNKMCKFQYPEKINDSIICREELHDCDQRNSFTCSFTPNTAMTEQIRFFLQTTCGHKTAKFMVNITASPSGEQSKSHSPRTAVTAPVGFFVIITFLIIIMIITYKKKQSCGFGRRMFQGIRRDENNSPVTMI